MGSYRRPRYIIPTPRLGVLAALDQAGQPVAVPQLLLEDEQARAEWSVGEELRRTIEARRGR